MDTCRECRRNEYPRRYSCQEARDRWKSLGRDERMDGHGMKTNAQKILVIYPKLEENVEKSRRMEAEN